MVARWRIIRDEKSQTLFKLLNSDGFALKFFAAQVGPGQLPPGLNNFGNTRSSPNPNLLNLNSPNPTRQMDELIESQLKEQMNSSKHAP